MKANRFFIVVFTVCAGPMALADVSLYSTGDCSAQAIIATIPTGQTLESCRAYARENGLENAIVESSNFLPGYCSTPLTATSSESFDQACVDFAGQN